MIISADGDSLPDCGDVRGGGEDRQQEGTDCISPIHKTISVFLSPLCDVLLWWVLSSSFSGMERDSAPQHFEFDSVC